MSALLGLMLLVAFGMGIFVLVPLAIAPFVIFATWWQHRTPAAAPSTGRVELGRDALLPLELDPVESDEEPTPELVAKEHHSHDVESEELAAAADQRPLVVAAA